MKTQHLSEAQIFELGRAAGADPKGWGGQCPFMAPAQMNEKAIWHRGFSAGRIEANVHQVERGPGKVSDRTLSRLDQKG